MFYTRKRHVQFDLLALILSVPLHMIIFTFENIAGQLTNTRINKLDSIKEEMRHAVCRGMDAKLCQFIYMITVIINE